MAWHSETGSKTGLVRRDISVAHNDELGAGQVFVPRGRQSAFPALGPSCVTMIARSLLLAVLGLAVAGGEISAQSLGSVRGTVTTAAADGSATPLPEASVALKCPAAQAAEKTARADEQGKYSFERLDPGKCTLTASAPRFRPKTQSIEIVSGKSLEVNLQLALEAVESTVTVTATSPNAVDTTATRAAATEVSHQT